mmetsp:Transcript_6624/g.10149  ORF Transcript_6624/g.10149 Transcript_6624/m.10149 type:complete len:379 (+) Transcript_6624:98-1234(+)
MGRQSSANPKWIWHGLIALGVVCLGLSGPMFFNFFTKPHSTVQVMSKVPSSTSMSLESTQCVREPCRCPDVEKVVVTKLISSPKGSENKSWLTIVIPSVSRGDVDYLETTLNSILAQIPALPGDPITDSIRVLIVDNTPEGKNHTSFQNLRETLKNSPVVSFHEQPKKGRVNEGNDAGHANKPGARVRRQTRDLVYTLRQFPEDSAHIFVMEDDFYFCPHALSALLYMIAKAYRMDSDWLAMKVSYGFNGILLRAKDVGPFATYLEKHNKRRPPDHLQTEWWAGEIPESKRYKSGRSYFVFRYNLLEHIGIKSSLRATKMVGFGVCGQEMNTELMFPVDAFKANQCGSNDMCPCGKDKRPANQWSFMANPNKKPYYKG